MGQIGQAVARQQQSGPSGLVQQYRERFVAVLPSHINPDTWLSVATSALKRGKIDARSKRYELEIAASNNPGAFLQSLLEAARLGLEPGTNQYYLTPRAVGKGSERHTEILGIVGYQGEIELIYRAGAVSSVIAEVVYSNDKFSYQPGRDQIPVHEIDWDSEDRGRLRLAYAYAIMKDGAYSKVVVLNKSSIDKIKASSQGSDSDYSPWKKWEEDMWLKSAVHKLEKWVPTSAEYIREQLRAERDVAAEREAEPDFEPDMPVDVATGELADEGEVPAEDVPDPWSAPDA